MAGKGNPENPWTWAAGGISLKSAGTVTPPAKGDITGDAPSAKDPDQLKGVLTWTTGGAPIAPGARAPAAPQGGITADAQYTPDGRSAPSTFAAGGAALVPGAYSHPQPGKGDIMLTYEGADGQKQTVFGEITWATGAVALVAGPTTHNAGKGDITGDYGPNELWKEIATWAAGNVPLAPGQLTQSGPKGDFPDPNTWQDVVVYRTSQLYPLYFFDHMGDHGNTPDSPYYSYLEHMQMTASIGAGNYYLALVVYSNWPIEHMQDSGLAPTGSLTTGPANHFYNNWPAEHMQDSGLVPSGNFYLALIIYSNWPPEHLQFTGSFSGGTLS